MDICLVADINLEQHLLERAADIYIYIYYLLSHIYKRTYHYVANKKRKRHCLYAYTVNIVTCWLPRKEQFVKYNATVAIVDEETCTGPSIRQMRIREKESQTL